MPAAVLHHKGSRRGGSNVRYLIIGQDNRWHASKYYECAKRAGIDVIFPEKTIVFWDKAEAEKYAEEIGWDLVSTTKLGRY